MSKPIVFKVLTTGEGGVGKTTLLHRYIKGNFLIDTKMTIGVEFFLKELIIDDRRILLQLWDFGGQERFRFMLESYVWGSKGAFLMFDLTRPMSLSFIEDWVELVRKGDPDLPILFIGTKVDLINEISVEDSLAMDYKDAFDMFDYVKVSSKTGENVEKVFEMMASRIYNKLFK